MKIHTTSSIKSLNDPFLTFSGYFPITWNPTSSGSLKMTLGPPLSVEESRQIDALLESDELRPFDLQNAGPSGMDEPGTENEDSIEE